MKLGMMARGDGTGLGSQSREIAAHLAPSKVLIVDVCDISPKNLVVHPEWYAGFDTRITQGFPTEQDCLWLLDGVDVVYSAETFYANGFIRMATERNVATVLHVNPEFCDHIAEPTLPKPTLFACPTTWLYDRIPEPKTLLSMPVATEHYPPRDPPPLAKHFRHVIGWPAIHDRAGTPEVLAALTRVRHPITVSIACQDHLYVAGLLKQYRIPAHVHVRYEAIDTENYWDALGDADVLLAPRRYGGLCLTLNEALAAGIPVISTALSPQTEWLPPDWLVGTQRLGEFMTRTLVEVHGADPQALAERIDYWATNSSAYQQACATARVLGQELSWTKNLPQFRKVLASAAHEMQSTPIV